MGLYTVDSTTGDLSLVAGAILYSDTPVGSIQAFGGTVIPTGWLICDGRQLSRTTYSTLFNVIGTSFGEGDGSTTFNLPDLQDKAIMGAGENGVLGESQLAQLPSIVGKINNEDGTFGVTGFDSRAGSYSGAFTGSNASGAVYTGQTGNKACKTVTFDSSKEDASSDINGNNVYVKNGEVRPANIRVNYIIKAVESPQSGSGGGGGSLSKDITAAIEVGGIDAGTTFTSGTNLEDLWDALLNPTLYPSYTAPSASLTYSVNTYYEVGATIAAKTATLNYNAGAITINGTKQDDRAGAATNYSLITSGADTDYSSTTASSGSFAVSALTRSTKGTITMTGTVSYAEGPQPKDSKGNDFESPLAAGTVTASKVINFIYPYYYGKSSTSSIASLSGLTKDVSAKGNKTYTFTTSNEYMVIAYDSSYGDLKNIIDPNGFETISGWTKTTLTDNGCTYNVYIAKSATTDTNAKFTFKY